MLLRGYAIEYDAIDPNGNLKWVLQTKKIAASFSGRADQWDEWLRKGRLARDRCGDVVLQVKNEVVPYLD